MKIEWSAGASLMPTHFPQYAIGLPPTTAWGQRGVSRGYG